MSNLGKYVCIVKRYYRKNIAYHTYWSLDVASKWTAVYNTLYSILNFCEGELLFREKFSHVITSLLHAFQVQFFSYSDSSSCMWMFESTASQCPENGKYSETANVSISAFDFFKCGYYCFNLTLHFKCSILFGKFVVLVGLPYLNSIAGIWGKLVWFPRIAPFPKYQDLCAIW